MSLSRVKVFWLAGKEPVVVLNFSIASSIFRYNKQMLLRGKFMEMPELCQDGWENYHQAHADPLSSSYSPWEPFEQLLDSLGTL
jgi:hypothetical protein